MRIGKVIEIVYVPLEKDRRAIPISIPPRKIPALIPLEKDKKVKTNESR